MNAKVEKSSVESTRIQVLNDMKPATGAYVLYWMQQSQRAEDNQALEYAVELANYLQLPVLVSFGLTDDYPDANLRHYTFMLEGLRETAAALRKRGIQFVVRRGRPCDVALELGERAAVIVCDRGYLRHQVEWRRAVAEKAECRVVQVESDVVVPLEVVSEKAEYAARTIRPKIHRHLKDYLKPVQPVKLKKKSRQIDVDGLDLDDIDRILRDMNIDREVGPVSRFFQGGTSRAKQRFDAFVEQGLKRYDDHSNQPQTDDVSHMSPYLHFGQISPLYLAWKVHNTDGRKVGRDNIEAYLEELVVRRELAVNFVYFTPDYDAYSCIPQWAQQTLEEHAADRREHRYSAGELMAANTHDPYWNAAMQEMMHTGFMHNYMRMYWGKKILEWSRTPQEAFETTIRLNNRYFVDGRDPNSYVGVAWIYGVHDRAWKERDIFGKVRYMAASGLERKCDIDQYVKKVEKRIRDV